MKVTFKRVLQIFYLFEENNPFKIKKSLELLGLENISNENETVLLNEISKYIFGTNKIAITKMHEKVFDINLDYKYYFADFLKYGINLNKQDIDWWEFNTVLNAILLDENSAMSTVIGYRTYEKPSKNAKTQEEKMHKFRMKMKRQYALPNSNENNNGLEKLWNYVEKKAGDQKVQEIKT